MKKTDFFDLVAQPALLNEDTLPALNEIVSEFPWFQAARMLLVKNLHAIEHVRFNGELKQSAAFIADRKRLFELIHHPAKVQPAEENIEVEAVVQVEVGVNEEKTDNRPKKTIGITTNLSSISNYFQTNDTFETANGSQIDFSVLSSKKDAIKEASSMVLPSADFLGYESNELVGYQLKESIDPKEKLDESHSFSDWLNMLRHAPAQQEVQAVKKKSHQIIDNFLKIDSPKIIPSFQPDMKKPAPEITKDKEVTDNGDDLMSETLANIYIKQKHYDKAIGIYEKLRLKYPEKNVYFARRISDLEKLTN
jgi:hypothetical protein